MKKTLLIGCCLAVATMGAIVMVAPNITNALAVDPTNEYGCRGGCTGEYEIQHVKRLIKEDESRNGAEDVRFKVRYVGEKYSSKFFEDLFDNYSRKEIDTNLKNLMVYTPDWSDHEQGKTYEPGDVVDVYGDVYYERYSGVQTLIIKNLVVYGVNGNADTTLLQPVNYIA